MYELYLPLKFLTDLIHIRAASQAAVEISIKVFILFSLIGRNCYSVIFTA